MQAGSGQRESRAGRSGICRPAPPPPGPVPTTGRRQHRRTPCGDGVAPACRNHTLRNGRKQGDTCVEMADEALLVRPAPEWITHPEFVSNPESYPQICEANRLWTSHFKELMWRAIQGPVDHRRTLQDRGRDFRSAGRVLTEMARDQRAQTVEAAPPVCRRARQPDAARRPTAQYQVCRRRRTTPPPSDSSISRPGPGVTSTKRSDRSAPPRTSPVLRRQAWNVLREIPRDLQKLTRVPSQFSSSATRPRRADDWGLALNALDELFSDMEFPFPSPFI